MEELKDPGSPGFKIGQAVLVDEGINGEVTAVERGSVPGVLGEPPMDTWLYSVDPEDDGDLQTEVPEYNLVAWPADWPRPIKGKP